MSSSDKTSNDHRGDIGNAAMPTKDAASAYTPMIFSTARSPDATARMAMCPISTRKGQYVKNKNAEDDMNQAQHDRGPRNTFCHH